MPAAIPPADERISGTRLVVAIKTDLDVVVARQKGRSMAEALGFSAPDLAQIVTAISELARNIRSYAECGEIRLQETRDAGRPGISIVAKDSGPGIVNVDHALLDGYSTSGSLGLGLPGVRRMMDEFEIQSEPGRGTTVTATKFQRP
jgi:serine/threonine-protein kinase RsbT